MSAAPARVRTASVLLFSAAALTLASCAGPADADPPGSPPSAPPVSASTTPTPSATPTPTYKPASADGPAENVPVPEIPDEASLETQEGLEAFIPFWFEALSYAYVSGDTSMLEKVTNTECELCIAIIENIKEWSVEGRWIVGGEVSVTEIEDHFALTTQGDYAPYVIFTQEPLMYYSEHKLVGESEGNSEPRMWMPKLRYIDKGWLLIALELPGGTAE